MYGYYVWWVTFGQFRKSMMVKLAIFSGSYGVYLQVVWCHIHLRGVKIGLLKQGQISDSSFLAYNRIAHWIVRV